MEFENFKEKMLSHHTSVDNINSAQRVLPCTHRINQTYNLNFIMSCPSKN